MEMEKLENNIGHKSGTSNPVPQKMELSWSELRNLKCHRGAPNCKSSEPRIKWVQHRAEALQGELCSRVNRRDELQGRSEK